MNRFWLVTGSLSMLLALAVAAASGHGSSGEFVPAGRQVLDTAREMHLLHSLVLLLLAVLPADNAAVRLKTLAGLSFLAGIIFFPGGIYASRLLEIDAARPLIPIGGMSFMLGWGLLALAAMYKAHSRS